MFVIFREEQNVVLPEPGKYATGILFIDKDADKAAAVEKAFEQLVQQANLQVSFHLPILTCSCTLTGTYLSRTLSQLL